MIFKLNKHSLIVSYKDSSSSHGEGNCLLNSVNCKVAHWPSSICMLCKCHKKPDYLKGPLMRITSKYQQLLMSNRFSLKRTGELFFTVMDDKIFRKITKSIP